MSKTVSASEAKSRFGSLLGWTEETGDPVIVERRGRPVGVLISYEAFEELQEQQKRLRKVEAWEKLRRLQERLAARPAELTEEEAERLADQAGKDIMQALIDKGEVRFEE